MFKESDQIEKFEPKVWLSSPTMHGEEFEFLKEAYETNWMSTGTVESLMQAAEFVQTVQNRQGVVISAPEEIAFYEKWITKEELIQSARMYGKSPYGEHLMRVAENRLIFQEEITYDDHRNRWSRIYRKQLYISYAGQVS